MTPGRWAHPALNVDLNQVSIGSIFNVQTPLVFGVGLFAWECDNFLLTSENCGVSTLLLFSIGVVNMIDPLLDA